SHDWVRLEKEGFKLLAFGSREHEAALESCDKIISSHAAQFVTDYFKDKRMLWKKFIFLQHGIIHNDQSTLFRPDWKKIDIFLTSGVDEYNSLAGEKTTYKFTKKEVKLTGLPRHDSLLKKDIDEENIILVMPTWRPNLLGKVTSGTSRELLPDFQNSEYAKAWTELLSSA
ncbi:CDP-glycerol glycerophosphotransferase family protein, partial [Escherichia coli]